MTITCTSCGHEGGLVDFERFDAICRVCRKAKGPRQRKPPRRPTRSHVTRRISVHRPEIPSPGRKSVKRPVLQG